MKFTMTWLKEHLETTTGYRDVAEALTDLGLEVENIDDPAESMGAFSICRVKEARKHPNADRLKVCTVEIFAGVGLDSPEEAQVVCGAPNARTGLIGVFAPAGTHIPGTGINLKPSEIRGVRSEGMLCSERELMISDEHDGIIELSSDAPLGARFIDYFDLNDPVIEIAVTPNRPDALGIRGIARDLAARGLGNLKPLAAPHIVGEFESPILVEIDADTKLGGCPVFFGRYIRGVTNGPSPLWMQRRLKAIGLRPISALVDITNYVTYDQNRPLHAFDADKVVGNLRVHFANGGEKLTTLDGGEAELEPGMLAISDENGLESIAGIMGGVPTSCTESTKNVFLESALWDPITTSRTGRKLKIQSDARYRFERGVDPEHTLSGLDFASGMVADICGGQVSEIVVDGAVPNFDRKLNLRNFRAENLVGMSLSIERQFEILDALGFNPKSDTDHISVTVPSWRPDIFGEADLVEEVARIASLSKLEGQPLRRLNVGVSRAILTPAQRRERKVRRTIAALGYSECVTYSFIGEEIARAFASEKDLALLENPISEAMNTLRPDLIPGLLQAAAQNQARGYNDLALFEVGPVFIGAGPDEERLQVAGLLAGSPAGREPHSKTRPVDVFDAKSDAEAAISAMGESIGVTYSRTGSKWWHPGRSGSINARNGTLLGSFGEIHPRILRLAKFRGTAVAFTLYIDSRSPVNYGARTHAPLALNNLQSVVRDFAFIVGDRVEASSIIDAVNRSDYRELFESVDLFDEFRGERAESQFGNGKKSLAVSVRMQPKSKPFKDAEIEAISASIIENVIQVTGGAQRA